LHEEPDEELNSEIVQYNPVNQYDRVFVRKCSIQELVDKDPEHDQVGKHDQEEEPHDDVEYQLFLPETGADGLLELVRNEPF
jgi:hypothetical protein